MKILIKNKMNTYKKSSHSHAYIYFGVIFVVSLFILL